MKEIVAAELAKRVKDGELLGIGTGSTVEAALEKIKERVVKEELDLHVVPTSVQSAWKCEEIGLKVLSPVYRGPISWGFDGADAVDGNNWLVKGKGAAMLQEKILAARCKEFVIIVDESKLVKDLRVCPVPVEFISEASSVVEKGLKTLGATKIALRPAVGKHGPIVTEAGNLIYDAEFEKIYPELEERIKSIVGVVESGLFIGYADEILVGGAAGIRSIKSSKVK
ncbi:MAG: ribose 5-phosphate isomerase A [Proteobacteria bacterium]|nr:MAG: ribose 5-phosphate isomerase A [Pseudomonadota bacterium]